MRIEKKKICDQFLINFSILVLTWGGLFRRTFNNDTITHMLYAGKDAAERVRMGRYLAALLDFVLLKFANTNTAVHTGITTFAGIIMLTFSLGIIQKVFEGQIKCRNGFEKLTYYAITALLFSNVLFAESLMFGECAIMFGAAYLLASAGVLLFTKKKYLAAFLIFLLSTMEYQLAVVYAAIIISAWIFIQNKYRITVETVKEELICSFITFGSGVLNVLSVSIGVRMGIIEEAFKKMGMYGWGRKLHACISDILMILANNKGLMPKVWLPLIVTAIACAIPLYKFIKEKNARAVLYYLLLTAALISMVYTMPMMQEEAMTPPRIVFLFYCVQAMLLLIAYICSSDRMRYVLGYLCCGYLLVQIMFSNIIVANHMISNTLDTTYATMVYEEIKAYEKESGTEVKKVAVINDTDCPPNYNNVNYKTYQTNERALGAVTNTLINVVSGRQFEKIAMDENIYRKYFKDKNWDYFNISEQLVIIEDTAYWAIF